MHVSGTFCDRCGKRIREPDDKFHIFQTITTYMVDTGYHRQNDYVIDLCPECIADFEEWVRKGKEPKEEPGPFDDVKDLILPTRVRPTLFP